MLVDPISDCESVFYRWLRQSGPCGAKHQGDGGAGDEEHTQPQDRQRGCGWRGYREHREPVRTRRPTRTD